ncbi:MAG: hypothetical protein JST82_08355 [Bacteroidetes bacterium]|nr:hypothetical protein [Bacteroidota bacterium]
MEQRARAISWLITILALLVCTSFLSETDMFIPKFKDDVWRKDSNGCLGLRNTKEIIDVLYCNQQKLIGLSEKEIIAYLGNPNYREVDDWNHTYNLCYYIERGDQCAPNIKPPYARMDVKTLEVILKENKVLRLDIIQGGVTCK